MKWIGSGVAAATVGALVATAVVATPSGAAQESTPSPQSIFPGCAWGSQWGEVLNTDTELANPALNAAEPDSSANYWVLVYTYEPGETITLKGTFPDARFQSFQVGTQALTDYQIAPDPGSVNPFQPPSDPFRPIGRQHGGRPGEHYTVTLSSDAQPGETNTLPLGASGQQPGTSVAMTMRDYLQTGGVWAVPAPSVTVSYDGVSKLIPPCSREQETFPGASSSSDASAASAKSAASVTNDALTPTDSSRASTSDSASKNAAANFAADAATSTDSDTSTASGSPGQVLAPFFGLAPPGAGANQDTLYLVAAIQPPSNGEVLVVKGKLPTTEHGTRAQPWPQPGVDLRYWSLCDYTTTGANVANQLPDGQVDWGCRHDDLIRVSRGGYYTFALGTEAQRAAIERIPGVTFLPFSEADPTEVTTLLIRNQLASPSFDQVMSTWPTAAALTGADEASAATADEQVMGAYYPKLSFSTIPALRQSAGHGR